MSVKVLGKNKNEFLLIIDAPCQLVCMIVYSTLFSMDW